MTSASPQMTSGVPPADPGHDLEQAAQLVESFARVKAEVGKVVVGQGEVIEQLLIAILARGHCLLEGVPGLAKTLMIRSLAETMDLQFRRIQFTPDLMPGAAKWSFNRGRSFRRSSWPTRSTARPPRPKPRCSKRCKNTR
jgi:hypothetical protein